MINHFEVSILVGVVAGVVGVVVAGADAADTWSYLADRIESNHFRVRLLSCR